MVGETRSAAAPERPGVDDRSGGLSPGGAERKDSRSAGTGSSTGAYSASASASSDFGRGQVDGAERLGAAGPLPDVGIGPAGAEAAHVPADGGLRGKERVGKGQVDPAQQVRVAGGVGAPVVGGAADPAVHAADPGGLAFGQLGGRRTC